MIIKSIVKNILSINYLLVAQCSVFFVLNLLDIHSTWLVLKPDYYHRERNPIARCFFRKCRLPQGIILYKSVLMSFLGVFVSYWWSETLTLNLALLLGNILYTYVVLHNYRVQKSYRCQIN